jgi:hypothetical protein
MAWAFDADMVLDRAKALRPYWNCQRVLARAMAKIEAVARAEIEAELDAKVRKKIDAMVASHRSVGKTFDP